MSTITPERLIRDLNNLTSMSAISLRRWLVEHVILSPEAQSILPTIDPPEDLVKAATRGIGATPEHVGVAARLIYEQMGRRDLVLTQLPTIPSPKSWNQADSMAQLLLWMFEPWNDFRYDPRSETVQIALPNGQWAFHLKGKDSENVIMLQIQEMMAQLEKLGFTTICAAMSERGLLNLTPSEAGVEASEFGLALNAAAGAFSKFCNRTSSHKELLDQFLRLPIMMFDTSTVNCVRNLAAFGNGVIPTLDIREVTEISDILTHPAGLLLEPNKEFALSSATGILWPDNPNFNWLMEHRNRIHTGHEDTWDDWVAAAKIYGDHILTTKCPTYKEFLDHVFPAEDGAPEERDAFLRLLGAAIFGTNLKIVAAFIGEANAGKDTVVSKWLSILMGEGQIGVLSPMALTALGDDQRSFAPLKGARLAVVSGEVGEGRNTAILAEKVKSITSGGGTLTVAEKYEKPTTIYFDGMLIMQGNSVPAIQGGDKALYRNRLVAVEFKHPFPLSSDTKYDLAYAREAPDFLQVLFLSYLDYMEKKGGMNGIDPPAAWQNFRDEVEFSADPLAVIGKCVTPPTPGVEIPSSIFYKALSILAQNQLGLTHRLSANRWAARLKRAGVRFDKGSLYRSRVQRAEYTGYLFHFTLDADQSDGFFTQKDWTDALELAKVSANI